MRTVRGTGAQRVVRRVAIVAVVLLAAIGTARAVIPFARPLPRGFVSGPGFTTHCSAPIVAAWHADHDGGWFGYAPLTSVPKSIPTCEGAARDRLAWASAWWASALAVVILLVVLRRRGRPADALPRE